MAAEAVEGTTERAEGTTEQVEAEWPLLEHLKAMGWRHIEGARLKAVGERDDFRDVLLERRLRAAVRRHSSWMTDDVHTDPAVHQLRTAARHVSGPSLPQANREATELLLHGVLHPGPDDRDVKTPFVDWSYEALEGSRDEVLARNDYVVVDQLRVCDADGKPAVLDLVLFVNGIPLVVIECKSPDVRDPLGKAIRDLRAYTGRPVDDDTRKGPGALRGVPHLFAPVQLLVAADGTDAALGTYSSSEEHYALWRSISSDYKKPDHLRQELRGWGLLDAKGQPSLQQQLTAIVLKPGNLLNIVRHYVFEMPVGGGAGSAVAKRGRTVEPRTAKVVCRHQQYRATEKIVDRLRTGRSRRITGGDLDERGGVIWHTQGAGKSFTMQFLARRLHASPDPALNGITLVAVTDRNDLQRQLRKAVALSDSDVREAKSRTDLESMLQRAGKAGGRAVIFATIQKFLGDLVGGKEGKGDTAGGEDRALVEDFEAAQGKIAAGSSAQDASDPAPDDETLRKAARIFPECSDSDRVLVLVDEAHRSHTSVLHACLRKALPNAARIGFTGTPLMAGRLTDTGRIFGLEPSTEPGGEPEFLDTYRMTEAERDKVVVPVRYAGRATSAEVRDKERLDECFEDLIEPLDEAERTRVREKYGTPSKRAVAESAPLIRRKAVDMLEHYVSGPLTGGFKAQVAVVSRRAAVTYRNALRDARTELLLRVQDFDRSGRRESLRGRAPEAYTPEESLLLRAWQFQELLRRIDFVPVISAGTEQKDGLWREWTDEKNQREHIARFLQPFPQLPPDNPWAVTPRAEPNPVPAGSTGGMNPWSDLVWGTGEAADPPPVAFLIVKSMLLTGFDAPIEQALYLDRPIRDAELLQAIARVNRPARRKTEGLVVDYYGVLNNLAVTLAAYQGNPRALDSLRDMSEELPELGRTAGELRAYLTEQGIDTGGLTARAALAQAVLALSDPAQRADFDRLLGEFLGTVDRVLPHEDALEFLADARAWSVLQMRVRRHYRDDTGGGFVMRGYGRKVRALIAEHLEAQEVAQAIAPVSILAPDFDEVVSRLPAREAAAEQVQGLRYHLEERQAVEDRAVFRQLSTELERVLEEFAGRWDAISRELGPLVERARQAEKADPAIAHLTPMEQRLYVLLGEKLADSELFDDPAPEELRRVTAEVYDEITSRVRLASFGGGAAHVARLEACLYARLRAVGYRHRGEGRKEVNRLASTLAGYAAQHLEAFRSEARRE
ncbi:type I restriction endonuclease subunit R [Streptomyces sp. NBC_01766]|uniref:type I restriction endonuclease subunit R n=1 Tax=Streptomyces sp. NBC_01766 TaxID=2975936 RepID=UPI002DDA11ED|nr:type I restriction endonuclease [Streptomyces sp. NBC_01766]WSC21392.1 type I restriction endonuclease [Streptomyces sp. NBC_01766]